MSGDYNLGECTYCGKVVMEYEIHNCRQILLNEIEELKERVEKWKTWYASAAEDAKKWRRDAQSFYGALQKIIETGDKMSVKYEAVHLVRIAREALADRP